MPRCEAPVAAAAARPKQRYARLGALESILVHQTSIRLAVCRCLRGASRSALSHSSMTLRRSRLNGGASRSALLRSGAALRTAPGAPDRR